MKSYACRLTLFSRPAKAPVSVCSRHPSGEFSYGNTSVSVKMMNQDGTFLPGELTQELGYVSTSAQLQTSETNVLLLS